MSSDRKTAAATAGAKLDAIATRARRTFVVNLVGVTVLVIAVGWAGVQCFRANASIADAASKFLKTQERLKADLKAGR